MFYKVITCDVVASSTNPDVHTHPDWLFDVHSAQVYVQESQNPSRSGSGCSLSPENKHKKNAFQ